jgi:hypothetical protein
MKNLKVFALLYVASLAAYALFVAILDGGIRLALHAAGAYK